MMNLLVFAILNIYQTLKLSFRIIIGDVFFILGLLFSSFGISTDNSSDHLSLHLSSLLSSIFNINLINVFCFKIGAINSFFYVVWHLVLVTFQEFNVDQDPDINDSYDSILIFRISRWWKMICGRLQNLGCMNIFLN